MRLRASMAVMGLLGTTTTIEARTGRKVSNALTLTFKAGEGDPLAVATQAGGLGVLLGFKNGGKSRYTVTGPGGTLEVDLGDETVGPHDHMIR